MPEYCLVFVLIRISPMNPVETAYSPSNLYQYYPKRVDGIKMQAIFLFATTVISLILFIVLISQGIPWSNFQIFFLSIIIIILMGSLVGFLFSTIKHYCWTSSPISCNPTPTTLYTNPPPIGSAEAEFQNEYIPVFPMRQLQPRVDLDKHY